MNHRSPAVHRSAASRLATRRTAAYAGLALLFVASLVVLPTQRSFADDTELLRANSSNPFLFILLDNSRSMASSIDDKWVHAGADDPRSRLYIAKEVLYEELRSLSDVHYGLATFNQDNVRVVSKHYLYSVSAVNSVAGDVLPTQLSSYPKVQTGPVSFVQTDPATGADDTIVSINGDLLTFGRTFPFSGGVQTPPAGTCTAPLVLSTKREAISRYPKLGANGSTTVTQWVQGSGNKIYRLIWSRPASATWALGDASITVDLNILEDPPGNSCNSSAWGAGLDFEVTLDLWKEFLWVDDDSGASYSISGKGSCGADDADELAGGFWSLSPLDVDVNTTCVDKPFSGQGWEGNYDTGSPFSTRLAFEELLAGGPLASSQTDSYCDGLLALGSCVNNKYETTYASTPDEREIDLGDMVPFHWTSTHHQTVLERLNPLHTIGGENFGVSEYFANTAGGSGSLHPVASSRRPILAAGNSPIGAAALDFRCWFVGEDSNKCNRAGSFEASYDEGFLALLQKQDPGLWACRRPFMIVITDLYNNCTANSDVANIAGMFSETSESGLKNGVSTWLLNMGTGNCNGLTNAGRGETIDVTSKSQLRTVLREILGEIEETARAFAAAAVPTVQADVEDKIYFTQFTPLQDLGIWPGEVLAFRKPLPTTLEEQNDGSLRLVPDRDQKVWDAGLEMMAQSPDPGSTTGPYYTRTNLKVGATEDERRVYYMVEPKIWNYWAPVSGSRSNPAGTITYTENELRNDLWLDALDLSYTPPLSNETLADIKAKADTDNALRTAHSVIQYSLIEKVWNDEDGVFVRNYILGDIFHSNPQVLSGPANPFFLSDPESFPAYDLFAKRQERRRKMLFVGANDGFMHAFDVGKWQGTFEDGEFDSGSGREIFGYLPREMISKLKALNESRSDHQWFVDGTPQLADVMIDVNGDGHKEWRTILVFGLRRGGESMAAIDITEPDPVSVVTRTLGGTSVDVGFLPDDGDIVPSCWDAGAGDLGTPIDATDPEKNFPVDGKCGFIPFGTPLWEVEDGTDDDGGGDDDMGQSWSAADIGPVRVSVNGVSQLRWVAIFGGGLDPDWETDNGTGNWLYMVDIETGKIIYKRQLGDGSAASPPAAVDTSQDGVLDRVYIGTTEGLLYRVDMSTEAVLYTNDSGTNCTLDAFDDMCITDPLWDPVEYYDTVTAETDEDDLPVQQRRPFFFRPAVFYVGQLGGFGVAMGTGNRDDIWASGPLGGNRFYVFADELCNNDGTSGGLCLDVSADPMLLPVTEAQLVDVTAGGSSCADDVITDVAARDTGERGWYVRLGQIPVVSDNEDNKTDVFFDAIDELMVTPPVTISGLTVFSTFVPETERTSTNDGPQCARRGIGRSYLYYTASGCNLSVTELDTLPSDPFLEAAQTQNPSCEEEPDQPHCLSGAESEDPCAGTESVFQELKENLFPSTCKFSPTFKFNLMTNLSDTGLECIVQIPVCIQQRNWKEF